MTREDLKKLLAEATPGPWTHASDKLAAGNIKAPDNARLIVAAINALPELIAKVKRHESALKSVNAWLKVWADDVECGLPCTPTSIATVQAEVRAALKEKPQ